MERKRELTKEEADLEVERRFERRVAAALTRLRRKKLKLTPEEADREDEKMFAKLMGEALNSRDGIHFNLPLEDNPRLQIFNRVLQEEARKKVN